MFVNVPTTVAFTGNAVQDGFTVVFLKSGTRDCVTLTDSAAGLQSLQGGVVQDAAIKVTLPAAATYKMCVSEETDPGSNEPYRFVSDVKLVAHYAPPPPNAPPPSPSDTVGVVAPAKNTSPAPGTITGTIAGAAVLLVIIAGLFYFWRTRKKAPLLTSLEMSDTVKALTHSCKLPENKIHHVFISYYQKESDAVFQQLMMYFMARGLNVFNQKRDLAGRTVNLEVMKEHAAGSVLVLALLSPRYFTSKWCRGELEAAKAAGVPIVPVFSGEHHLRSAMLVLLDEKEDPEKAAAVKAAFDENLIDINNGDHADTVAKDLNSKIIGRFLASSSADV